ncbi:MULTISPECIES: DNA repair protein RecO [unclassified Siphonobacter]|uniref:DNA repair protein RecO n=1 Tax=unclassified Siphonobacter TaxID=2635712 RepID=UPI000CB6080E|nr:MULTISPECIES: DNA repair protein RecO [unclassified Siphonobacter]MDQ1086043.1 DNA repair protein RecO (recombination protein O) [Siphonobacter sp. SORGH_AS_1065]MDR6196367.1 DNA repair protein RecO (recombination protein O) [Siphonobacter sp. SORGH_AS_0500]PKK38028.1 DNA repair protein RecO [Siphonobacter sp. SORGH_AS_0500]
MLQKTRGLVLNYLRYRETSIIVKIYTEEFGVQTYIENGVRSSKGKNKIALFQPLTLLDLVVYFKDSAGIQRISEIKVNHPYSTIPFDITKSTIALFITEVLSKTLKEEAGNPRLFQFLRESLIWLDQATEGYENFHLWFLLRLSFYLGFEPTTGQQLAQELRLAGYPIHDESELRKLDELNVNPEIRIGRSSRNYLLEMVLKFYELHVDGMGEVRSLEILRTVFS